MIFTFVTKHGTLIRRSTVLSLTLPLVFLAVTNTLAYSTVLLISTLKIFMALALESLIVEKERYLKEAPCFLVNSTFH
jgi:hypothetical protein